MRFHANPPLGLYIHLPWCERKCPYCDFNSYATVDIDEAAYIDALIEDLQLDLPKIWGRGIDSIFIGGGTPSLFSPQAIGRLISELRACLNFSPAIEFTLEANPGSAEAACFEGYLRAGVNRLSIGVQSFNNDCLAALGRVHDRDQALDAFSLARQAGCDNINLDLMYGLPGQSLDHVKLQALGRIHSAAEARAACQMARAAGFDNLNLDLMYGLPGQTEAGALDDLAGVIAQTPEHISWYQLTLEPNTPFHHRPPALPDEDALADMMAAGEARLADAGYRQYEISAYACEGRQCRHNLNYWRFGDYLGIGAGAHGKLSLPDGRIRRRTKQRQPAAFVTAAPKGAVAGERLVAPRELGVEFFLNALRLVDGVPADLYTARIGLLLETVSLPLARAHALGLMSDTPGRLQASARGRRFLNDLLELFEP